MKISKGRQTENIKLVIYGPEGVGKTTFANKFPAPLNLDIEDGSKQLDVERVDDIINYDDVIETIKWLITNKHEYKTLIIDTADWLEKLCDEKICTENDITSIEAMGYGQGYGERRTIFGRLLTLINVLKSKMNVIFLAHSKVERIDPPQNSSLPYDHISLKCSKQVAPLLKEWCDALLFMTFDDKVEVDKQKRAKAIGGNERIMYTQHTAFCDAKNRFGLDPLIYADYSFFEPFVNSQIQNEGIGVPVQPATPIQEGTNPLEEYDEDNEIPGLSSVVADTKLVILKLNDNPQIAEELATKYFCQFGWIKEGQIWRDASEDNMKLVLARSDSFIQSVQKKEAADGTNVQ